MTRLFTKNEPSTDRGAYVVRRLRATDALGASLRGVYEEGARLPSDMTTLLARLDSIH